jgi:hypothetical protein
MSRVVRCQLGGNNLTQLATCTFHGLRRSTSHTSFNVHLRSNSLESIDPCTFDKFARSTIHIENNPLICNCSFNYLLYNRQSLAYTGQECRGGFAYPTQNVISLPAVRKTTNQSQIKPTINITRTCQDAYKHYHDRCSKLDCTSLCSPHERYIIQVTTIVTPSGTRSLFGQTFVRSLFVVVLVHSSQFNIFV